MASYDEFFNPQPVMAEQASVLTEFKPNPKKTGGEFNAVVRFLPNPVDPRTMSIISKYIVYLEHPRTKVKKGIDCPTSIGEPSPLANTFFSLRNSTNPVLQENSKQFSRKQQYASLVQVLSCKSDPTLENKILVWRYGIKVYDKIQSEMNPQMGTPREPFNPIAGRPFAVCVKEVSGFPNYDKCNFFDLDIAQSGMRIQVQDNMGQYQWAIVTEAFLKDAKNRELVFNYIKENAPDTEKYRYHEWDADTAAFVNECIQIYSNPTASIQAASMAQNPGGMQIQQKPMTTQAAAMPTVQMPTFAAPMQAPAMPQMNVDPMPIQPTMGLNEAPSMNVGTGFSAPVMNEDINSIMNQTAPQTSAMPQNLDLSDVLNGQFMPN